MYGQVVSRTAIALGILFALGYFSVDIREVASDGVPMEPAILGIAILFCLGAGMGATITRAVAPADYLANELRLTTPVAQNLFRLKMTVGAVIAISATAVVLYLAMFGG